MYQGLQRSLAAQRNQQLGVQTPSAAFTAWNGCCVPRHLTRRRDLQRVQMRTQVPQVCLVAAAQEPCSWLGICMSWPRHAFSMVRAVPPQQMISGSAAARRMVAQGWSRTLRRLAPRAR